MTVGLRQQAAIEDLVTAFRVVIDTVDDDWGVRAELHGDTTLGERFLELIQQWGYISRPAKGAEGVVVLDESGAAILGTRNTLPSTVANDLPTSGNTMLYNANGKRIYMKDGKIQLHPDGTLKAIARNQDGCVSNDTFDEWAAMIEAALVKKQPGSSPPVATPWEAATALADIDATSTVTESG